MERGIERELKLRPSDPGVADRLAVLQVLGPFAITWLGRERQRNSFFDTRAGGLRGARVAFRRRVVRGVGLATWSLKGEGRSERGVAVRPEEEVQLAADTPPLLAFQVLMQAAQAHGNAALAEEALAGLDGALIAAEPYLEIETERRRLALRTPAGGEAELALDDVRLVGHPGYHEAEIEVELRRGDESLLEEARAALEALGEMHPMDRSKLARALRYLDTQPADGTSVA